MRNDTRNIRIDIVEVLDHQERDGMQCELYSAAYLATEDITDQRDERCERFRGFGIGRFLRVRKPEGEYLFQIFQPNVSETEQAWRLYRDGGEARNILWDYSNVVIDGEVWSGHDPFDRYIPF